MRDAKLKLNQNDSKKLVCQPMNGNYSFEIKIWTMKKFIEISEQTLKRLMNKIANKHQAQAFNAASIEHIQ